MSFYINVHNGYPNRIKWCCLMPLCFLPVLSLFCSSCELDICSLQGDEISRGSHCPSMAGTNLPRPPTLCCSPSHHHCLLWLEEMQEQCFCFGTNLPCGEWFDGRVVGLWKSGQALSLKHLTRHVWFRIFCLKNGAVDQLFVTVGTHNDFG